MTDGLNRRRFLTLASVGTATSLAGCPGREGQTTGAGQVTTDDDGTRSVTMTVQPDQEQLRQRQQEIRSELEAGNITRQEAQQQAQTVETELREMAIATFRDRAGGDAGVTVTDSVEQFGVLLVSGPASAVLDTLGFEEVSALLPRETFQQAKQQAQQGGQ